jgi:hypothetical protein
MSRKFLRGLSVWIAAASAAVLAFASAHIHHMESVLRARRLNPHVMSCANGYFDLIFIAVTCGLLLGMFLAAWFWHCYDRASGESAAPGSQ